ncbi:serine protease [Rathayibacter tritici]|uniref:serine protease n=1 Tax=Rathayibacter tritici TaxID=33888 RepID=UPI000CE7B441|nr:serine protease [Rathayibacter tritici]PPF30981.1 serine protease [Rathayibacter tritici]PPF67464.1 serine protease [Rathayibacter tritici]PPG06539.1 serine protease [Rathayibacter tritici]PPI16769.1 serine protease [Rathayibacter tritici]
MTAYFSLRHRLGRRFRKRRRIVLASLAVAVALIGAGTAPANAVSEFREKTPLQAGSRVELPRAYCTVGAVLSSTSWYSPMSPGIRKTRYVVLAGHCGNEGDSVSVADQGVIGRVIWESGTSDLEIARIDPIPRTNWNCASGSMIRHCDPYTTYSPRAIGNIFLRDHTGRYVSMPFDGMGVPGENEVFCTSGAVSGVNCTWGIAPLPPRSPPFLLAATTWTASTVSGDSGGPVASRGGRLYGIITDGALPASSRPDLMAYVPISRLFEEQRGYVLAPPG